MSIIQIFEKRNQQENKLLALKLFRRTFQRYRDYVLAECGQKCLDTLISV